MSRLLRHEGQAETLNSCDEHCVHTSTCAGEYLCNYVLFKSLCQARNSMFIHIPAFSCIDLGRQVRMVGTVLEYFGNRGRMG